MSLRVLVRWLGLIAAVVSSAQAAGVLTDQQQTWLAVAALPSRADETAAELKKAAAEVREAYETIALALLPIFEKEPDHWEAVTFLGRRRSDLKDKNLSFEEVLAEWRLACPECHRPLVGRIAAEFGVAIK